MQSMELQLPVSATLPAGYLYDRNLDPKKVSRLMPVHCLDRMVSVLDAVL